MDRDGRAEIVTARGRGAAREILIYQYVPDEAGSGLRLLHRWTAFSETENPVGGMDPVVYLREIPPNQ